MKINDNEGCWLAFCRLVQNTLMTMAEAMGLAKKELKLQKQLDKEALIAEINANTQ